MDFDLYNTCLDCGFLNEVVYVYAMRTIEMSAEVETIGEKDFRDRADSKFWDGFSWDKSGKPTSTSTRILRFECEDGHELVDRRGRGIRSMKGLYQHAEHCLQAWSETTDAMIRGAWEVLQNVWKKGQGSVPADHGVIKAGMRAAALAAVPEDRKRQGEAQVDVEIHEILAGNIDFNDPDQPRILDWYHGVPTVDKKSMTTA